MSAASRATSQRIAACAKKELLQEAQNAYHPKTYKWATANAENQVAKVEREASKVETEKGLLEKEDQKEAKADFPKTLFGKH